MRYDDLMGRETKRWAGSLFEQGAGLLYKLIQTTDLQERRLLLAQHRGKRLFTLAQALDWIDMRDGHIALMDVHRGWRSDEDCHFKGDDTTDSPNAGWYVFHRKGDTEKYYLVDRDELRLQGYAIWDYPRLYSGYPFNMEVFGLDISRATLANH